MLRTALSILLTAALLIPPGMCVCDHGSTHPESDFKGHEAAPDEVAGCPFHSCHEEHHPAPTAPDDHHAPGCPAKTGTAEWKAEVSVASVPSGPNALVTFATPDLRPLASAPFLSSAEAHSAAFPIFLATVSLRI